MLTQCPSFPPAPGRHPHHCAGRTLHQGLQPCLPGHLAEAGWRGGPCSGPQVPLNPPEEDVSLTVNKRCTFSALTSVLPRLHGCLWGGREGSRRVKGERWPLGCWVHHRVGVAKGEVTFRGCSGSLRKAPTCSRLPCPACVGGLVLDLHPQRRGAPPWGAPLGIPSPEPATVPRSSVTSPARGTPELFCADGQAAGPETAPPP